MNLNQMDMNKLTPEIIEAANKIGEWAKVNGFNSWELMGIRSRFSEPMQSMKSKRDAIIDAAVNSAIRIEYPTATASDIQRMTSMSIFPGGYVVSVDGKPYCLINLLSKKSFSIEILSI